MIKFQTLSELMETKFEPCVVVDDGWVTLLNDHGNYDIELTQCNTAEAILHWVAHLSEKIWVTNQHINEFVEATTKAAKVKIH